MIQGYILSVEELRQPGVLEEAWHRIDRSRQDKAERLKRQEDRIRSVGAGLLLQYALQNRNSQADRSIQVPSLSHILQEVEKPLELEYIYGDRGKPYLGGKQQGIYFSLSHSGNYVLCAISDREAGGDIQQRKSMKWCRLANRFFAEEETRVLESLPAKEQESFFYRLWVRKEAYGKLTGKGLLDALRKDVWDEDPLIEWAEYYDIPEYSAAICSKSKLEAAKGGARV